MGRKAKKGETFVFFFILLFLVFLTFALLDLNFRSGAFIKQMRFSSAFANILNTTSFGVISAFFLSCILFGIFTLLDAITSKDVKYDIPIFVIYILFIYINLLYFKFFLMSLTYMNVTTIHKHLKIPLILALLLFAILYIYRRKKISIEDIKKWTFKNFGFIPYISALILILSIILFTINLFPKPKTSLTEKKLPNIILITFDSLSATHMSLYGYQRKTTPNIEEFAKESCVFLRMHTNTNSTGEALKSFLGRYPRPPKETTNDTFVSLLKEAGYPTRVFTSITYFPKVMYKDITYSTTIHRFEKTPLAKLLFKGRNRDNFWWISQIFSEPPTFFNLLYLIDPRSMDVKKGDPYPLPLYFDFIIKTLRESSKPVFIWFHTFDPHFPYLVPPSFKKYFGKLEETYKLTLLIGITNRALLTDRYDTSIRYCDEEFGKFIKKLKEEGLYDNSIIIVSADHGESFGDPVDGLPGYGIFGHGGSAINDEITHIPLIIHIPHQRKGRIIETFAEQVDLAPTLMDLLGIPKAPWMEGESLLPYMKNPQKLSKKVKITIPGTHFYRSYPDPRRRSKTPYDIFTVFWYKYKIGFRLQYDVKKLKAGPNPPISFQFNYAYNVLKDPQYKHNLLKEKSFDPILDMIYKSPLIQYYKSISSEK